MSSRKCFLTNLIILLLMMESVRRINASAVLISDVAMTVMVELSSRYPFCKMHTDRGDIQRMLLHADPRRIRQVPRESVMELEDVCKNAGSHGVEFRGGLGFIYPGTKWCGPGTIATNYDDLGTHTDEDRCCREHDHCPDVLNVGECRRGLCNSGTFTRSHCDCDARFRRCLQSLNTETANTLGAIFYNVVQVTCFQERSPCSDHQRFISNANYFKECELEFRSADLYIHPNIANFIDKLLTHLHNHSNMNEYLLSLSRPNNLKNDRTHSTEHSATFNNPIVNAKRSFGQYGIKLASIGMAAINILRELVNNPRAVYDNIQMSKGRNINYNYNHPYDYDYQYG